MQFFNKNFDFTQLLRKMFFRVFSPLLDISDWLNTSILYIFQGKKLYPKHPDLLSFITFGGLSLLAGLCTLCLPETGDEDLPDTVAEAEHIGEHKKTEQYDDNTLVRSEDCAPTQYSEVI